MSTAKFGGLSFMAPLSLVACPLPAHGGGSAYALRHPRPTRGPVMIRPCPCTGCSYSVRESATRFRMYSYLTRWGRVCHKSPTMVHDRPVLRVRRILRGKLLRQVSTFQAPKYATPPRTSQHLLTFSLVTLGSSSYKTLTSPLGLVSSSAVPRPGSPWGCLADFLIRTRPYVLTIHPS